MKSNGLPLTEEIDFHYLLTLLPPLYDIPEFAWLPELFSVIGYDKLIELCRYCGGEQIKLPTLQTLSNSIEALQNFYDVYLMKRKPASDIPQGILSQVQKIRYIYDAQNRNGEDK
ncbi:hypothetical protein [Ruminococcus sp.]|uniref:hypothetical protein n=1 Tax=Ruminococcus sp. TaxID=41978 RepID=UPI001B406E93|nr:hypothetical protein [Ruminococcus sp.]MBP5433586.1 hypothetical protein [Ruminococcus sp.]